MRLKIVFGKRKFDVHFNLITGHLIDHIVPHCGEHFVRNLSFNVMIAYSVHLSTNLSVKLGKSRLGVNHIVSCYVVVLKDNHLA